MPHLGQLPADIPSAPWHFYTNKGWAGMGDWLGTGTIAPRLRKFRSFVLARAFVRKLKFNSASEWKTYCKGDMTHLGRRPEDIPSNPNGTYADKGWSGWGDWLGTGRTRVSKTTKRQS